MINGAPPAPVAESLTATGGQLVHKLILKFKTLVTEFSKPW